MSLLIALKDAAGLSLVATIQRTSDNFYWNDVASAFQSAPSFANKSITLTEGSSEDTNSYTASVSDLGSPGEIIIRIHEDSSKTRLALQTSVIEDTEVSQLTNIYHADIDFIVDELNARDEYTATWFRNGERLTTGITSPTIQVVKRTDGTDLIASTAMTQIGSSGSYKYDESTDRVGSGESAVAIVGADVDGETRSFAKVIGRDS